MTENTRAIFYHLSRSGLQETLFMLLKRAHGAGWRVMVRGAELAKLADLDAHLWAATNEDGFLPHGMQGGAQDADQPILLGTGAVPDGMDGLFLLDSATTSVAESAGLRRVWVLFDGGDEGQLDWARGLWKTLTTDGMAAQYWTEDTGKWAMKMERPAAAPPEA
jgi:DNA polymerase-3 subunit chi